MPAPHCLVCPRPRQPGGGLSGSDSNSTPDEPAVGHCCSSPRSTTRLGRARRPDRKALASPQSAPSGAGDQWSERRVPTGKQGRLCARSHDALRAWLAEPAACTIRFTMEAGMSASHGRLANRHRHRPPRNHDPAPPRGPRDRALSQADMLGYLVQIGAAPPPRDGGQQNTLRVPQFGGLACDECRDAARVPSRSSRALAH